ncbi:MAG TPA: hypothetical protein VFR97_05385 [Capillimicrobium sp.]|nr:hypothetical protein [Capillimicrobium sp.]
MRMKRFLAVAAASASLAGAAAIPATVAAPAAFAHSCGSGYTHAVINGAHKCLRRGQFCAINADSQYHRYGYHCHTSSRDSAGNYHLT